MDLQPEIELPVPLQKLSDIVKGSSTSLTHGNDEWRNAALQATKFAFDLAVSSEHSSSASLVALLSSLTPAQAPQTRSQTGVNAKRKRTSHPLDIHPKVRLQRTPLPFLHIDGMSEEQIWTQLDLRASHICRMLNLLEEESVSDEETDGSSVSSKSDLLEEGVSENGSGDELDSSVVDDEDTSENEALGPEAVSQEEFVDLHGSGSDEDRESDLSSSHLADPSPMHSSPSSRKSRVNSRSALDDGFFSLASFNAETEEAEARRVTGGSLGHLDDSEDSDTDDVDLLFDATDDMSHDAADGAELYYNDFFDPPSTAERSRAPPHCIEQPARRPRFAKVRFHEEVKVKSIKAEGKGNPVASMYNAGPDDDVDMDEETDYVFLGEDSAASHRSPFDVSENEDEDSDGEGELDDGTRGRLAIERLRDDLFVEEEYAEKFEDVGLSSHEQRLREIQTQIEEFEAENVAKKPWTLMGEASSKVRPHASLLEEDLEFERGIKSAPLVTEELVRGLEGRIKQRVKESRYDDVVRRRPVDDKPFLPSRYFELQDTKSAQSLAQIYENDYIRTQNGNLEDDRDGQLKAEHDEVRRLWDSISNKLDALCNAHYVPKQPKASITTVSNAPAATLESALPTSSSVSAMLAPEEIFASSASVSRARSELTSAEKKALRTKERKARKKARDALNRGVDKLSKFNSARAVKKQKEDALKGVVKSGKGVTVVGKKSKAFIRGKDSHSR